MTALLFSETCLWFGMASAAMPPSPPPPYLEDVGPGNPIIFLVQPGLAHP